MFDIEDSVERTQCLEALRGIARQKKRITEFNNIYKSFVLDFIQRQKQTGNKTKFTGQPLELECDGWTAGDMGVYEIKYDKNAMPYKVYACGHPILPVEILKNVDTSKERISVAYFKYGMWQNITVDRGVCADPGKIVETLSPYGIDVTAGREGNSGNLVRYLSDCVELNPRTLEPKKSINRLGWIGSEFVPYVNDIRYEGDSDYEVIFKNIRESGDFLVWKEHCSTLRKNKIIKIVFAASLASVLLKPLDCLPFVVHLWSSASGTCKTVAIMSAMSIWGNPEMGGLVKTMNNTKVNFMRNAAFLHSLPFAGDELQTIKDKWQGNYDQLIYQLTEGIDRGRGKASGGVEETKTWKNTFLFTGEEPITKANSRSGSKNRVIEIEATEMLMESGNATVSIISKNHGFAGRKLIEYIKSVDTSELVNKYKVFFNELCKLDTTEKQAMAMSCLLLADEILVEQIFTDEIPLSINDVKQYLHSNREVDMSERAYQATLNWVAKNPVRFENPKAENAINKGEVWGRIERDEVKRTETAIVNKEVLLDFLEKNGFDYTAVSKKWAYDGKLIKNSQGKFIHNTRVYGIKANYVKLIVPTEEQEADKDGFIYGDQMELPFE